MDALVNIVGLLVDTTDKVAHNLLQSGDRWEVHEQCDETANVTFLDGEVDIQKQHQIGFGVGRAYVKKRSTVAPYNRGKRHSHGAAQNVSDRGQTRVQDNVAGLRESLLFQIDDIFKRMFPLPRSRG